MRLRKAMVAALCGASMSAALAQPLLALECAVSAPASVAAGQAVHLRFVIGNAGAAAVQVLAWGTPFEGGWFAPYVRIWRDGVELAYAGASLKRGEPLKGDYLRLAAGQQRSATVEPGQAFDLVQRGRYRIVPQLTVHDSFVASSDKPPRPREKHRPQTLACATVEFVIL